MGWRDSLTRRKRTPEQIKRAAAKRRRRKLGSDLTAAQWRWLQHWTDGRCFYCWKLPERLEKDCVVPLRSGGKYTLNNVVPACPVCNHNKGGKKMLTFLKQSPFDVDEVRTRFELLWACIGFGDASRWR